MLSRMDVDTRARFISKHRDALTKVVKHLITQKTYANASKETSARNQEYLSYLVDVLAKHQETRYVTTEAQAPSPAQVIKRDFYAETPTETKLTNIETPNPYLGSELKEELKEEPKVQEPAKPAEPPKSKAEYKVPRSESEESLTQAEVDEFSKNMNKVTTEINKVFIGQKVVVDKVVLALMCDAHALLEGVPGLAKSLLVEVMSKVISGTDFKRIQFLPDMLPADVIGGQIYDPKNGIFKTIKGPIFANFVLADEINRAPPKTHAALMECMQEKKITIDVEEFILDRPFLVLATQNPLENKGTYALPEAVLDRFMFKLILLYPEREHEKIIITQNATTNAIIKNRLEPVITKQYLLHVQARVKAVYISDAIKNYILDIVHATRGDNPKIEGVKFIQYGAGPRASIYLGIASKAQALMRGRNYVLPEDVHAVAPDILRHRVCLNFKGKAHNISPDKIVEEILMKVSTL
jgi:MoxR-like ATPase